MFNGITKAKKLALARKMATDAISSDRKWQRLAREDFAFRDGYQWTQAEKDIMAEELRPILTMNLTKSSCDLIMGMNEDNKIRFRCSPAEPTDGFLAEVLNDLNDWVNERFDFEEEEDGALESAVICGRGYVGIDFMPDPDRFGDIIFQEVNIPVHEVHFDPASRRHKLEDASYIIWDRWLTRHDFQMRWPNISKKKLSDLIESGNGNPVGEGGLTTGEGPQHVYDMPNDYEREEDEDYETPLDYQWYDRSKNMIRVVHMEYWEMFKRYFVFNPQAQKFEEVPEKPTKEHKELFFEEFGQELVIEEMTDKKVKWLIFSGDSILFDGDSPLPYKGFSIVPVFAYRDMSQRTPNHFGVVRLIKDPQKEVNKRWSQALNMLNQQVQPGMFAETDAFVNDQQAEQSLKEPGAITYVHSGVIAANKIKERGLPAMSSAPMQMEQFSQDIIKRISGINPDLLGQDSGRQEPGVVVRLRQQQGVTLLKPLFNNFNKMKREMFKRQLSIIMEYMPDEQILRILGQNDRYQIGEDGTITDQHTGMTANIRNVRELEYNVVSEQSPGNMSKRMMELSALLEMSQQLPVPPDQIIDKMDIPATDKNKWIQYIEESKQSEQQQQEQMLNTEIEFKDREITADETKNMFKLYVDLAKLHQMGEKDEKAMVRDFAKMDQANKTSIMQLAAQLASVAAQAKAQENKAKEGGTSHGKGKQASNA